MDPQTLSAPGCGSLTPSDGLFDGTGRESGSYVWGADTSTKRLALSAAVDDRAVRRALVAFEQGLSHGARLQRIYEQTLECAAEFARSAPPASVFVEELVVFPGRTSPILYQAKGVIEAALFAAVGVDVVPIPNAKWKRIALGYGHAKKHEVLEWARRNGYDGVSEDQADADGTAVAGWRIVHAPVQETLAA